MNLSSKTDVNQALYLVRQYPTEVIKLIWRIAKATYPDAHTEDVEDICYNVYSDLLEYKISKYNGQTTLSTFICVVAKQSVRNYFRDKHRKVEAERKLIKTQYIEETKAEIETTEALLQSITLEPNPVLKEMLTLRFVDGLGLEDIARRTAYSIEGTRLKINRWISRQKVENGRAA